MGGHADRHHLSHTQSTVMPKALARPSILARRRGNSRARSDRQRGRHRGRKNKNDARLAATRRGPWSSQSPSRLSSRENRAAAWADLRPKRIGVDSDGGPSGLGSGQRREGDRLAEVEPLLRAPQDHGESDCLGQRASLVAPGSLNIKCSGRRRRQKVSSSVPAPTAPSAANPNPC